MNIHGAHDSIRMLFLDFCHFADWFNAVAAQLNAIASNRHNNMVRNQRYAKNVHEMQKNENE